MSSDRPMPIEMGRREHEFIEQQVRNVKDIADALRVDNVALPKGSQAACAAVSGRSILGPTVDKQVKSPELRRALEVQ